MNTNMTMNRNRNSLATQNYSLPKAGHDRLQVVDQRPAGRGRLNNSPLLPSAE